MPYRISIDPDQIKQIQQLVGKSKAGVNRQLNAAITQTAKQLNTAIAKVVAEELVLTQKVIKQSIKQTRSTPQTLKSTTTVPVERRISLREFGAKQNSKGVTYRISKKKKDKKFIPGAFMGPKPGVLKASWRGNVFKREGKARLPIAKKSGPSVWGVYVKSGRDPEVRRQAREILRKQVQNRIDFLIKKLQGII